LKYTPIYPSKPFDTIDAVREWVLKFTQWYNNHHRHSGIKFVTPHARHSGKDKKILKNRERVYKEARIRNPERWTGNIRNWDFVLVQRELENSSLKISNILNKKDVLRAFILLGF
jgi:hypothetical protein